MCVCVCVCVGSSIVFLRPGGAVSRWHWQSVMALTEREKNKRHKDFSHSDPQKQINGEKMKDFIFNKFF